jgi:hypothetical protein
LRDASVKKTVGKCILVTSVEAGEEKESGVKYSEFLKTEERDSPFRF